MMTGDAGPRNAGASSAVLAKAVRILNRALRAMQIPKDAGNFMGLDYKNLPTGRQRGLLYYFIDEAKAEGVMIRKGAPFYFNKLAGRKRLDRTGLTCGKGWKQVTVPKNLIRDRRIQRESSWQRN